MTTAWTVLIAGLSLLAGAGLGAWLYAARMRRNAGTRLRLPERWPLRVRRLVSGSEKEVWSWLRNSFPGHLVMVKIPVLRFTMLQNDSNNQLSPSALADAQVERGRWLELLNGVYSTFTLCTMEGKVVGCVDVSGQSTFTQASHELKENLFLDCGIAYLVVSASNLPTVKSMRATFLGEIPVESVAHQVTRGGDSEFHADMSAFTKAAGN